MTTRSDEADTPKIITVAEGLIVRQAVDNMAWIDLGDDAVAVDALEQPELEAEVFGGIAATLGEKHFRAMLNTHTHYDHVALNPAFERRGAAIVNARDCKIGPDGLRFDGPRRRVLIQPMPGCHTDEDCIVWVEPERVLFVGDIFGWGLIPLTRRLDAASAGLLDRTYARLIGLGPSIVVGGHGPLCSAGELGRWVEYFQWLRREAVAGVAAGKTDEQIVARLAPPEDMRSWWRFLAWKHADSVAKVVQAARAGRLG